MFKIYTRNNMADTRLVSRKLGDASRGVERLAGEGTKFSLVQLRQRKPRVTSILEWSNGGDHSEPWPPKTSTVCVMCYNSGELGWYESGEREITSVCVGTREGRSGDCGRRARSWKCSLPRQGGNDNDNPIRKINNKVQVYQYGV